MNNKILKWRQRLNSTIDEYMAPRDFIEQTSRDELVILDFAQFEEFMNIFFVNLYLWENFLMLQ